MTTFRLRCSFLPWLVISAALLTLATSGRAAPAAEKKSFRDPSRLEPHIRAFEAADRRQSPPEGAVLFVGSSTIVGWKTAASFPDLATINRGFGGSYLSDSLHFADRIVRPYRPKVVVLYAGDNDVAEGKTPEQIAADFQAFVAKVRTALPKTPILYLAIKPSESRWKLWPTQQRANRLIAEIAAGDPQLTYVDTATPTLGADGRPRKELFRPDKLHLNEQGYALWSSILRPHLRRAGAFAGPSPASNLKLASPIDRWDEAIPLGNGLTGGLLYGSGSTLKLALDRGDLWDLRVPEMIQRKDWNYATLKRFVAEKNAAKIAEWFDHPYDRLPYPTKIPGGRVEILLGEGRKAAEFSLDLRTARGSVDVSGGRIECFFSAAEPVVMLRATGPAPTFRIVAPDSLKQLGYGPPKLGREGDLQWSYQEASLGLNYALVVASRRRGDVTEAALCITSSRDAKDPLADGKARVAKALERGFDALRGPHEAWWREFWEKSGVRVSNAAAQQHYDLVQYFYGAASRRGAPPMPLQGVWSADAGTLPPWHGDYHNDLNTQLTYWAYLASGRFDEGLCFLDFLWDQLPVYRKFAKEFYGAPGAAIPGVMALDGQAMGGWAMYSLSPTNGAWNGFAYYLHWRYTMDAEFLHRRAYPFCVEIGTCLEALLKPGDDGLLKLPLSSSPEIHDNTLRAWLRPNSNYDLAILKAFFGALVEMAKAEKNDADAGRWQRIVDRLGTPMTDAASGVLKIDADQNPAHSHRHLSHLMAVHPFRLIHNEGDAAMRKTVAASFEQIEKLGTDQWCGYSFGWYACMTAGCGRGDLAWSYLDRYLRGFVSRNGFHLNGDFKNLGYSSLKYRPFTLEGNFAAGEAVHEMLLQGWGGVIRIFPATPEAWPDAAFERLRVEGGFVVSASRESGKTTWVCIGSERGGMLRLRDPFAGRKVQWNREVQSGPDGTLTVTLKAGETLEGRP